MLTDQERLQVQARDHQNPADAVLVCMDEHGNFGSNPQANMALNMSRDQIDTEASKKSKFVVKLTGQNGGDTNYSWA